jgi:dTDP-4-amino-4,6-dideoxygalactose transaminase
MSAQGVHKITEDFEKELCRYTGAPFALAVDNMSNALWLCLMYYNVNGKEIYIPKHTYPSVPCEIILAGGKVKWLDSTPTLKGHYQLLPYPIWDSALRFTSDMYMRGQMQCISFTGPYKHLKLNKGGAILLDNEDAYKWLKKARNSGRDECSYHVDTFTMIGRNCYMMPETAARGIQLIGQFYHIDGTPMDMEDTELPYPDLSDPKHTAFQ